jgi:hypothetical protein
MIASARRSFTLLSGLKYSHLAYIVRPGGHVLDEIFTRGVFPTDSLMSFSGGPYPLPLFVMALLVVVGGGDGGGGDGARLMDLIL